IQNLIENFADLIDKYQFIPNGNRTYYLSRSQPPYFSLMLDLLAERKGDAVYIKYRTELEKEYLYWTSPENNHKIEGHALCRYYDQSDIPRSEAYLDDVEIESG